MRPFANRTQAGRELAVKLGDYANRTDVLVLALPRGGVPVAFEVAEALHAPLDVLVVRKLGAPWNSELALGAIASGGITVVDRETLDHFGIDTRTLETILARERTELLRRELLYRRGRPFPVVENKVVVLVDDGLATGATMSAAVKALKTQHPARIVVAVPIASGEACASLSAIADVCACVMTPDPMYGVGFWYDDFAQTSDDEVLALLRRAEDFRAHAPHGQPPAPVR